MKYFVIAIALLSSQNFAQAAEGKCLNAANLAASAFKATFFEAQTLSAPSDGFQVSIFSNLSLELKDAKKSASGDVTETYLVKEENTHTRPYANVQVISSTDGFCFLKSITKID